MQGNISIQLLCWLSWELSAQARNKAFGFRNVLIIMPHGCCICKCWAKIKFAAVSSVAPVSFLMRATDWTGGKVISSSSSFVRFAEHRLRTCLCQVPFTSRQKWPCSSDDLPSKLSTALWLLLVSGFYHPTLYFSFLIMWYYRLFFFLCQQKVTKLGQFRLKDESPSSGSSLQPGSLFFNRDNATKTSPSLKGKTNFLILSLVKLCWIFSLGSIEKFLSALKDFYLGFLNDVYQAFKRLVIIKKMHFFFYPTLLASPQNQKLTYAAATLQTGGSSTSTEQALSSNSASQQVQDITGSQAQRLKRFSYKCWLIQSCFFLLIATSKEEIWVQQRAAVRHWASALQENEHNWVTRGQSCHTKTQAKPS